MAFTFTDANFTDEVENAEGLVVVDFWAVWCGPCQMLGPIIEELAVEYEGQVKIGKLDVDANQVISQKYGIMGIPAVKFFKNGEVVHEITGVQPKEVIQEKIEENK
jgi:thioredoxin 1